MTHAEMEPFIHVFRRLAGEFRVLAPNRPYRNRLGDVDQRDADRLGELMRPVFKEAGAALRSFVCAGAVRELDFYLTGVARYHHENGPAEIVGGLTLDPLSDEDYWISFTGLALREKTFAEGWTEPRGHETATWSKEPWPSLVADLFRGGQCEFDLLSPTHHPDKVFLCTLSAHVADVLARLCAPKSTGFVPSETELLVYQVLAAAPSTMPVEQIEHELRKQGSPRSDKPIKKAVTRLIQAGLAHRPNGERGGAAVTPEGRQYFDSSSGT